MVAPYKYLTRHDDKRNTHNLENMFQHREQTGSLRNHANASLFGQRRVFFPGERLPELNKLRRAIKSNQIRFVLFIENIRTVLLSIFE